MMPSFVAFLRSAFAFVGLFVGLWCGSTAFAAAPSHAHRYPDAVVAKVWTPTGERWVRLERTASGLYRGSVEFASGGWMAVTEYYDFTCLLTLDDPTAPLKFHHEFRSADGFDAAPSEFWASLTFNWATGAFERTEDFAAVFDDPAEVAPPQSGPGAPVSSSSPGATPSRSTQATPPPSPGTPGPLVPTYDADGFDAYGFDRSGYDREGYDANGYDRDGADRQGFNRDGVYQGDFDAEGYDSTGYDRDGYDRQGYDHNGRDREGYDYEGFDAAGYNRYGGYLYGYDQAYATPNADGASAYDERGFDAAGHNLNGSSFDDYGYDLQGYDREGFDVQGFNRAGEYREAPAPEVAVPWYDARGFDTAGLNEHGTSYDDLGYDVFGYDSLGYDNEGYDRNGFDGAGWNRAGRDVEGYDRDGRNVRGFNRYGIHRNTTLYDDRGLDFRGYNRSGEYFAGYDFNQPTDKAPESKGGSTGQGSGQPSGLTAQQQALAELLVTEGFPSGPQVMSDQDIAKLVVQYGSVDKITPAQWEALERQCLDQSLTLLWYDLENRLGLVQLGLSDEDPAVLRAKQIQIEEYLLGGSAGGVVRKASGQGRLKQNAASPEQSFVGKTVEVAKPEPVGRDTWKTAAWAFSEALVVGVAVGALVILAAPVVITAATAVLAAAGMSAASLTIAGGAIEGGLLAYAAYDVGKTAVEVKADLDAGRLDAAASKVGGMTGTIIGGVGASKVVGKGVTGAAGEVVGETAEAKALRVAKEIEVGMPVDEVFARRVLQADRVGSALKDDVFHRSASFLSLEQLQGGRVFNLKGGDGVERKLLQVKGGLNGKDGVYEYILDSSGSVTHQRFIPDGKITGIANQ